MFPHSFFYEIINGFLNDIPHLPRPHPADFISYFGDKYGCYLMALLWEQFPPWLTIGIEKPERATRTRAALFTFRKRISVDGTLQVEVTLIVLFYIKMSE